MTRKSSKPTMEKKVKDFENGTQTDWQDSADWNIGDTVPFKLEATLGNGLATYETYMVEFVDTPSDGLTVTTDSVTSVKVGDKEVKSEENVHITMEGKVLHIKIDDVLIHGAADGTHVVVLFNGVLNDNAKIGLPGNPNTAHLEYSNNPNHGEEGTNRTPDDTVVVFTYKVVVNKVHKNAAGGMEALAGAGFTLYRKNGETKTAIGR